ncbi:hypothetical protein M3Y94_00281200 [Aphelenchoides besseyi]|nr:hypothetical protein M3Y94_00281200 [Aphelenchoides besseyi]
MVPDIVEFNVGGKLFTTTYQTISFDKTSSLYAWYIEHKGSAHLVKDKNGAYFIDRDPKCFAIILNYLRLQSSNQRWEACLPKEPDGLAMLIEEAAYFKLTILHDSAKALLQHCNEMFAANEYLPKATSFHQGFDFSSLNLKE